jgi:exopolyphosphatase/guanosine-5'-triphosphate,3'-diphosphate pyrophosphatase
MWGFRVTRAQIRHLVADLAQMTLEKRRKVAGLTPQRADIIVAGLAIIERIMRRLRVNVVQVHTRGVRDGLLLTMISSKFRTLPLPPGEGRGEGELPNSPPSDEGSTLPADERRAAVEEFARNCGVDLAHARQVARIAGSLWKQLAAPLELVAQDRELIESAALVANVGYLINFEGHHKHSYHLIVNSELSGFERRGLQLLANVARYHRGNPPKRRHENYGRLAPEDQRRVASLAAILRLALALDRTHQQHVGEVRAAVRAGSVKIVVEAHGDADVDLWAAERKVELFEKVFGRKVRFSARGPKAATARRRRPRATRRRRTTRETTNGSPPRRASRP